MVWLAVVASGLLSSCAAPGFELQQPIASPENACQEAYVAWITAQYPDRDGPTLPRYKIEALEPLYAVCTVRELTDASARYLRKAGASWPSDEVSWIAEMDDSPSYIASERREYCDELAGTVLCVDIESGEWNSKTP